VAKRKVKRFVIDVNSYITLFINNEADWLLHYVLKNRLEIFIDSLLIEELTRVLAYPKLRKLLPLDSSLYINVVKLISTQIVADDHKVHSPDDQDDYLFNIALTSNAKLLVTGEKALLKWEKTPVPIVSLATFKEMF
jgi:uncharacterized protein